MKQLTENIVIAVSSIVYLITTIYNDIYRCNIEYTWKGETQQVNLINQRC